MGTEPRDDLIENEGGSGLFRDRAQCLQEPARPEIGPPALHGLDENRGKLTRVLLYPGEAFLRAIIKDRHIGDGLRGNPGRNREHARCSIAKGAAGQDFVELAMIVAGKIDDALASGDGARNSHRRHHGFRASVAKGCPLIAGQFANEFCGLSGKRRLRPKLESPLNLRNQRIAHEVWRMTESRRSKAVEEIDIDISIGIPKLRSLGADGDDWINDLLPLGMETRRNSRVGEHGARLLSDLFRAARAACIALDKICNELALHTGEGFSGLAREGYEGAMGLGGFFGGLRR